MTVLLAQHWTLELLGRLHPMLVHFPIALLVVAAAMELVQLKTKRKNLREGISWLVYIGAASATISAIMGLLLTNGGAYSGDLVPNSSVDGYPYRGSGVMAALFLKGKPMTLC